MTRGVLHAWLAAMILASCGVLLCWVLWALLWPFDPLHVRADNLKVVSKRVPRGEQLIVWLDYCKSSPTQVRIDTMIEVGGALFVLPPQYPPVTTGCRKVQAPLLTVPISLPVSATNLPARVTVGYHYEINALRTIKYTYTTDVFYVEP